MKIVEQKRIFSLNFEDIKKGEIFEYDGTYWLKVFNKLKNEYYGVCIAEGTIYEDFNFSDKCRVVKAELHILD